MHSKHLRAILTSIATSGIMMPLYQQRRNESDSVGKPINRQDNSLFFALPITQHLSYNFKKNYEHMFPTMKVAFAQQKKQFLNDASISPLRNPLPTINYDRKELDEIIEKIPFSVNVRASIIAKLEIIENRIDGIHAALRAKNPSDFYTDMRLAMTEIKNSAQKIYELAKPYRIPLAHQLQKKILSWVEPLDKELAKIMEISIEERKKLELKTKRLYAEQSFICRQENLQLQLMEHLAQIRKMLLDTKSLEPYCYLSYAWPSSENEGQEYWIQPFLSILYDHLKQAGVDMIMDIRNNKPGHDINNFMSEFKNDNHIILVGTESLLEKHDSYKAHAIKTELSLINQRFEQDQERFGESRIYPLLISGTHKSSFPPIYDKYRTVKEGRDNGYLLLLKNLIEWLYNLKIEGDITLKLKYQALWDKFLSSYPDLTRDCSEDVIEQEIAENYHHKRLDELNQDLNYQKIKAQQEVKHSEVVIDKIIAAYMESIGLAPKALFEESGQQFQRPYNNPNFVERKSLWDKMLAHFDSQEKLVLMAAHGLGGMGKTELAGYYYMHPPRPYSLRAWFYAATRTQLYQQYIELAEANGIFFPKEMPIEEQAQRVKKWLEEKKDCLLVYDNVVDASEIYGLLPEQGKHHILITSRNAEDFPADQCLPVDIMEEHEAIELIVKITGINKDKNLAALKELANLLGYLPLALSQAAGFMGKSTSIAEYITIYKERQVELLNNQDEINQLLPKHEPIWITFDINFKTLNMNFPLAIATIKQASWLASQAIPEILLLNMVEEHKDEKNKLLLWSNIKKHIYRYSLMRVDTEKHLMSIHPVIQDILRSKQTEEEQVAIFKQVSDYLDAGFYFFRNKNLNYKSILSHAERLYQHNSNISALAQKQNDKDYELLLTKPDCLDSLYFDLGLTDKQLKYLAKQKQIYEDKYGVGHFRTAKTLNGLGTVYHNLGMLDEAKKYYEQALKIKETHYGVEHFETATTLANLGAVYSDLGRLDESKDYYERALKIEDTHYGAGYFEIAKILSNLGNVYGRLEKFDKAGEYYEHALKISETHYGVGHFKTVKTLLGLGSIYRNLGKPDKAEEYYERVLNIQEAHYGVGYFEIAKTLSGLGNVCIDLGKPDEAKKYYERALKIQEEHYGMEHFETAATLVNLGNVYLYLGKFDEAKKYLEAALKVQETYYGVGHFETSIALGGLGEIYVRLGKPNDAKKYYEKALEIQETHFGKGHFRTAQNLMGIGNAYAQLGNLNEAKKYYENALKIQEAHFGKDHVGTAITLGNLGNIYARLGKPGEAKNYYENALEIQETHFGKGHFETATTIVWLGSIYAKLGRLNEAKNRLEEALRIQETHFGKGHFETATTMGNLGSIYTQLGNLNEAKNYYENALKIQETHFGKGHFETAATLGNLGSVYAQLGEPGEAKNYCENALKIQEAYFGKGHFEAATTLIWLGNIHIQLGRLDETKNYYESALAIQEKHYGPNHIEVARTLLGLGWTCLQLKQLSLAKEYLLRSAAVCRSEPHCQQYLPTIETLLLQTTNEAKTTEKEKQINKDLNDKPKTNYRP